MLVPIDCEDIEEIGKLLDNNLSFEIGNVEEFSIEHCETSASTRIKHFL